MKINIGKENSNKFSLKACPKNDNFVVFRPVPIATKGGNDG